MGQRILRPCTPVPPSTVQVSLGLSCIHFFSFLWATLGTRSTMGRFFSFLFFGPHTGHSEHNEVHLLHFREKFVPGPRDSANIQWILLWISQKFRFFKTGDWESPRNGRTFQWTFKNSESELPVKKFQLAHGEECGKCTVSCRCGHCLICRKKPKIGFNCC